MLLVQNCTAPFSFGPGGRAAASLSMPGISWAATVCIIWQPGTASSPRTPNESVFPMKKGAENLKLQVIRPLFLKIRFDNA